MRSARVHITTHHANSSGHQSLQRTAQHLASQTSRMHGNEVSAKTVAEQFRQETYYYYPETARQLRGCEPTLK